MLYACTICGQPSPTRRCRQHGNTNQRPTSWQRGYTQTFRRNRTQLLQAHPVCAIDGCTNPATVADHEPPRRVLVAAGVQDPDGLRWLQPLCRHHHAQKTRAGR